MNKCLGDARGIPRGIPGAAPGHPRGSPGAPGDPRSTGHPGGRVLAGTLFWGRTFRVNPPKTSCQPVKKGVPELLNLSQRQSTSVNVSQRQPPVPGKVVSGPRPGTTLLHAPGTKMT